MGIRRCALLAALLLAGSGETAEATGVPELLRPIAAAPSDPHTRFPPALREQRVEPDLPRILGLDPRGGTRARVTLFSDVSFRLRFEQPVATSSGGRILRAVVEEKSGGRALFSVQDDVVIGDVVVPGRGEFHLRALPGGGHLVREIDTSVEMSCGGEPPLAAEIAIPGESSVEGGPACPDDGSVFDVLAVYTAEARASAGGTSAMIARINQVVAYTNQAYVNSQIASSWNIVETMEIPYVEDGDIFVEIGRVRMPDDGHMDEVPVRRDAVGADVVSLFVNGYGSPGWCGVAASIGPGNPAFAYNIVKRGCPTPTFAHEVGHNAGCAHEGCSASYNRAHIVPGQFATIMKSVLSGIVQHHSNPDVLYQGTPTGVAIGQSCPAHNAQTINDNALAVASLRCSFVDCNANGVLDVDDIAGGTSDDCNGDDIPDECQPDCNMNGVQDQCDVTAGTSDDCNGDLVPDECQPDCNTNGVQDDCDIVAGTSDDCNGNGVPDECDLASGTSLDCNANSVPDECDVFYIGTSPDCNGNWIPDECEADCNMNGVADDCDIAEGTSLDCNANGVPDSCDLGAGTSLDVDHSGVPDECEDCDANGVVDADDIAGGLWPDLNSNLIPDPCENVHNVTRVKYHLTIQLGLDGAGDGDLLVVAPGTYGEAIDFLGKRVVLRATAGPELTTIDATGLGKSAVTLSASPTQEEFPFGGIVGFTITGGVGNLQPGGERLGGGIHLEGGLLSNVQNCKIVGNAADRGGGLYAGGSGGASGGGGAVANTVFRGNAALLEGGAVYVETGSYLEVHASTFHLNSAPAGGAIFGTASVNGSILRENGPAALQPQQSVFVSYSDVEGGAAGTGNIDADPLFVDAAGGNYRLLPGSPCIDAAGQLTASDWLDLDQDLDYFEPIPFDLDLAPRQQDGDGNGSVLPDMGAYEAATSVLPPPPIPDGTGAGAPLRIEKLDPAGNALLLDWDPDVCPPEQAKAIYGWLDALPALTPIDGLCGIGSPTLLDPPFQENLWILVVADNPAGEEGSWGESSAGERGGTVASGLCGANVKVLTATCP